MQQLPAVGWALVQNGVVIDIDVANPAGRHHPSLTWFVAPAGTSRGMTFNGISYQAAPPIAQPQQPQVKAELEFLDSAIPRGLEDMWTATHFDTSTLPQITQQKLARKIALRAQLASLVAAGTP